MSSAYPTTLLEPSGERQAAGDEDPLLPAHYCGRCMAVAYQRDERCLECGRGRPETGWQRLSESGDGWLGRIMKGRYLITRRLGKGASATVYEAESLNISRRFAIKVVDLGACGGDKDPALVRARLDREIEAISRLQNPHTVPFYEVISLSESCVAIVMKFVRGQTLDDVMARQGPMDWRRAARLLRQIATGVYEAHQAGLIHRDLKPANIMVEELSVGDEFVHVLDFGIVWIDDGVEVTRGFVGTPLYASPEQALGEPVDRRSDIYALGAIFFEMLTGRPPFQSKNVIEVLRLHVGNNPPALDDVLEAGVFPQPVQDLVDRMLAKSREARPTDLSEVVAELDYLLRPAQTSRSSAAPSPSARILSRADRGVVAQTADGLGVLETMRGCEDQGGRKDKPGCKDDQLTVEAHHSEELARCDSDEFFDEAFTDIESLSAPHSVFESDEHDTTGPKAAIFWPRNDTGRQRPRPR